jgi:acyl carrier protein
MERVMEKSLADRVTDAFVTALDLNRNAVVPAAHLRNDLKMTALELDDLADELEDILGIKIDNDIEKVNTVADVIAYCQNLTPCKTMFNMQPQ